MEYKDYIALNSQNKKRMTSKRSFFDSPKLLSLKELSSKSNYSNDDLIETLEFELKKILEKESLEEMIREIKVFIFDLKKLPEGIQVSNLFYQELAPLLIQSMEESTKELGEIETIHSSWRRSIRIALEEVIYYLQSSFDQD